LKGLFYLSIVILISTRLRILGLRAALTFLGSLTAARPIQDLEKASPFECGFIPQASHRVPFSLHFFLTTILFLVFDVELVLLFPYLLWPWFSTSLTLLLLLVLVLLTMGLVIEWSQNILE
jgi:NADH:ubiquinone oxidoreductase subunit 3 (subunit A)